MQLTAIAFFFIFQLALIPGFVAAETFLQTAFQHSLPKYIQENGTISGICYDIITELNTRLRDKHICIIYPFTESPFIPWKRMQIYLKDGDLDIIFGMAKNKKRQRQYIFSRQSLYTVHSVFAQPADSPFQYHSFSDLKGKQIIAVRGTKTAKMLLKNPEITISLTHTPTASLQMLLAGRGDLAFYHDLGLAYIIKKHGWQDKIKLEASVEEYDHFIAYNKKIPLTVREQIDTELKAIKRDGTMKEILHRYR
jgi:ABC-type amino acid transport substrate-binding protein